MTREETSVSSLYFMQTPTATRLKRVRQALDAHSATALLETHLPSIYYLSGFTGDSGALLVEPASTTLFADGRFTIQAKEEVRAIRTRIHSGPLLEAVGEHLRKKGKSRVAISPSRLTLAAWKLLKKASGKNVKWV